MEETLVIGEEGERSHGWKKRVGQSEKSPREEFREREGESEMRLIGKANFGWDNDRGSAGRKVEDGGRF